MLVPGAEGCGEVLARLNAGVGQAPVVRLGRDFQLYGELVERLASIEGLANVSLVPRRGRANLKLVA